MAEVKPIHALRYEPDVAGGIGDLVAPPYDVIDAGQRAALLDRSPRNVVELDLPVAPDGGDPYAHAGATLERWLAEGLLVAERDPSLWALEQQYTDLTGEDRVRRALICRVRVTDYGAGGVRPHERTQPGPKEDRLRLTRATGHNLSPIFCLADADAYRHVAPALTEPWAEVTDEDGTIHRVWPVRDPRLHEDVANELSSAELLIADGHHRYETARTYAAEVGGEGDHRYTLAALVSLDDPGLTVFGYHRLLTELDGAGRERLWAGVRRHFEVEEVERGFVDPVGTEGIGVMGLIDAADRRAVRLTLRDRGILEQLMPGRSRAYQELDAAILEALLLKDALGLTDDDIEAKRGIAYCKGADEALHSVESEECQAAFVLRPTPMDKVRDVAAAGETMPPKSTYFFPKLLTGFVFNPVGGRR